MNQKISLLPIDVGFDLRLHDRLVSIDVGASVSYLDGEDSRQTVTGCGESTGETLARAGYSVVIAQTSSGREIRCTPRDMAPVGDFPKRTWDGPSWAIQSKHDNYWCIRPSLAAALKAAGWSMGDITWMTPK